MIRPLACSFASLAMAVIVIRGAIDNRFVEDVIAEALVGGMAFAIAGGVAGWILDDVIRQHVRQRFEDRLRWYRDSVDTMQTDKANGVRQVPIN